MTGDDGQVRFQAERGRLPPGGATWAGMKPCRATSRSSWTGEFYLSLRPEELDDPEARGQDRRADHGRTDGARHPRCALVSVLGRGRDGDGRERPRFQFPDLLPGLAEVRVEMLGYGERADPVTIHSGRTTALQIKMAVDAIALAPIEVEVRSRFLETPWRLRPHGAWRLEPPDHPATGRAEPVGPLVGASRRHRRSAGQPSKVSGRILTSRGNCEMDIWVDGIHWSNDINGSVNIDEIPPEWIEVAEIYTGTSALPGSVPARWPGPLRRHADLDPSGSRQRRLIAGSSASHHLAHADQAVTSEQEGRADPVDPPLSMHTVSCRQVTPSGSTNSNARR